MKSGKPIQVLILIVLLSFNPANGIAQENELNVIGGNWLEYTDVQNSLYHYFAAEAYKLLKQRSEKTASINDLSDWQQRQKEIRRVLEEITGPFPEKTPLNAKVMRVVDKEYFRIENVIFESQPKFYVTASLFIPSGINRRTKAPAVIYCSGHSADGYRSPVYQHVILNLVKKGFIVLAFDPVGQGERLEYFDPETGKSIMGGPTMEHSYPGAQAFITGSSQAMYMIWDGIRAVDYLLTRKEVDPSRIGITGRSGGGTQSAYIAAFDDRILAAAPENYLTNYRRLLQSIGPQDAEQNLFNIIYRGLDHPDFMIVRAPKPALMITTTRDMFSIQGAIETGKEVKEVYKAYGKEDNFSRVEDDAGHESTVKNREALYAFFQRFLSNPGNSSDELTQPLTQGELQVTETGQVSTSLAGETVYSLNLKLAQEYENRLNSLRNTNKTFIPEIINSAGRLSGYNEPSASVNGVFCGRIRRDKYVIEKYFIHGKGDIVIPFLIYIPENKFSKIVLYLNPAGKGAEGGRGGEIEKIVNEGFAVLAPDLCGYGEIGPGDLHGDAFFKGVSHNLWYASMLVKQPIAGMLAEEIVELVTVAEDKLKVNDIAVLAKKELCPAVLHAAAFDKRIRQIVLSEPYSSYYSIVKNHIYDPVLVSSTVPGALKEYDLPDLASSLAPRRLVIEAATDGNSSQTDSEGIMSDLQIIINAYHLSNADKRLTVTGKENIEVIMRLLQDNPE